MFKFTLFEGMCMIFEDLNLCGRIEISRVEAYQFALIFMPWINYFQNTMTLDWVG
jgi:hypothetical protein